MAGLWADNFLQYGADSELLDGVYAQNDGWTIATSNPPRAGYKNLRANQAPFTGPGYVLRRIFGATKTTAGWAFRIFMPNLPIIEGVDGSIQFGFLDAANGIQVRCVVGTDGALVLYRGGGYSGSPGSGTGFTFLQRSVPCLTSKAWNHIELKCTPASSGAFESRVNGVTRLNYSGNTQATANTETSQCWISGPNFASGMTTLDIADKHAWDDQAGEGPTDFVGNVGVLDENLASDTADAGFTLSTGGTGYTLLTDNSDSTYIQAAAATVKSGFGVSALPSGTAGIVYRQLNFRGLKTDASDCNVAPSFKSSGSETTVTGQPMTTAQTWRWGISGKDPATSAPWTRAGAAASEACVTRTL